MPRRLRKHPRDFNSLAFEIVKATTEDEPEPKNAAAVELGRLGGAKGGKARASRMTPEQRAEAARKAARARWKKS